MSQSFTEGPVTYTHSEPDRDISNWQPHPANFCHPTEPFDSLRLSRLQKHDRCSYLPPHVV